MNIIANYNQNATTESIRKSSNTQSEKNTQNNNKVEGKVTFSNESRNLAESITSNKERAVSKAILNEVFKK